MFKKYSIAIILVSFMLLSTSVINGKALNKNSMLYNYLIQEENTDRSILIKRNGKDVTIKYLPILNDLIKKKETSKISDFVRDVHIIIFEKKSSQMKRAYHVIKRTEICPRRTKTVTRYGKKVTASWQAVLECRFSYNGNNYKIGTVYETSVSLLYDTVGEFLDLAYLTNVSTPKGVVSNDGYSISIKGSYNLEAKLIGLMGPMIDFGRYTEKAVVEA